MPKLDPMCIKGEISFAVTNREELIPCCYLDTPDNISHPLLKKLLGVSKISSKNTIEQILNHKEWKRFYKNLTKNIAPPQCNLVCRKNKLEHEKQSTKVIDASSGEVLWHTKR